MLLWRVRLRRLVDENILWTFGGIDMHLGIKLYYLIIRYPCAIESHFPVDERVDSFKMFLLCAYATFFSVVDAKFDSILITNPVICTAM